MFKVGDKIRVNSVSFVLDAKDASVLKDMSADYAKNQLSELTLRLYNLVTNMQTIRDITADGVYVEGDSFYMKFIDIEKEEIEKEEIEKVKFQRMPLKELRQILCSK